MRRVTVAICLIACLGLRAFAQKKSPLQPIDIGHKIPDVEMIVWKNGELSKQHISKYYHGKWLIIDFWATWCSPCLYFLRTADTLDEKYAGKLDILPVAYEAPESIANCFKGKLTGIRRRESVVADTRLASFFPHKMLPHEVWIDSTGIVRYITSMEQVSTKNIASLLKGESPSIREKKDKMDFDMEKLFEVNDTDIVYRSVLTHYNASIPAGFALFPPGLQFDLPRRRAFFFNDNAIDMYYTAFMKRSYFPSGINWKNIELHVKDSSVAKEDLQHHDSWFEQYTYCYELLMPSLEGSDTFWKYVFGDLNRVLPLRASIQKRLRPCWFLRVKEPHLLQRASGKPSTRWDFLVLEKICAQKLNVLTSYLNGLQDIDPVLDETHIDYPVNLDLHININQDYRMEDIVAALQKNGLALVRGNGWVDTLIIEDK